MTIPVRLKPVSAAFPNIPEASSPAGGRTPRESSTVSTWRISLFSSRAFGGSRKFVVARMDRARRIVRSCLIAACRHEFWRTSPPLDAGGVEEMQYSANGPVSRRDTEDEGRHDGEQQQEREHKCGHKFFSFDAPK